MAKLVMLWIVAVVTAAALAAAGHATENETLMLVTFFTCKLLWFLYLALLLEWMARLRNGGRWLGTPPESRRRGR